MQNPLIPRRFSLTLIITAFLLPIAICVVLGVCVLLDGMSDTAGAAVMKRIALAGGVIWAIDLISLLLVLALDTLGKRDQTEE